MNMRPFIDLFNGCSYQTCLWPVLSCLGHENLDDVVPLTDLKTNPDRVVKHVAEAHCPVLLTSRGSGVAVVQSMADYEQTEEERTIMRRFDSFTAKIRSA